MRTCIKSDDEVYVYSVEKVRYDISTKTLFVYCYGEETILAIKGFPEENARRYCNSLSVSDHAELTIEHYMELTVYENEQGIEDEASEPVRSYNLRYKNFEYAPTVISLYGVGHEYNETRVRCDYKVRSYDNSLVRLLGEDILCIYNEASREYEVYYVENISERLGKDNTNHLVINLERVKRQASTRSFRAIDVYVDQWRKEFSQDV